ncbi:hypothetical protein BU14_0142s0005 [Porphyra umbilicalis]|uniref:DUF4440 domain-containing protein n=1 Tax=Porphyra umbilicalis TaxID=2786 RepID=A0A1X6P9R3_PORUM|nr:hypothetical protein BU14_0142s0005 [Porphyra umbilicalis]|eukprot:OSX77594.1 hypothetical protein BU14_0142s0005 [Porphyra umbilicalis]
MAANVETANAYMTARMANKHDEVLSMVAPSIRLTSSRDGTYTGLDGMKTYLSKVAPTGTWQPASSSPDGHVEIAGTVKFMMVPVSVKAKFGFDDAGKITSIDVGRK